MRPQLAPVIRDFTDNQGLPLNGVTGLLQDDDGYLWIGTYGGLARFDGQRFRHFTADIGVPMGPGPSVEALGPASNRIISLGQDDRGRLWIGTEDAGISLRVQGRFLQLDACERSCRINAFILRDNTMWVVTDIGLMQVDMDSLQTRMATDEVPSLLVGAVFDASGELLVITPAQLLRLAGRILIPIPAPAGINDLVNIQPAPGGAFIASGIDLYRYTHATGEWHAYGLGPIESLYQAPDGELLVSLRNGRLLRMEADGRHTPVVDIAPATPFRMTRDNEGNIWVGTHTRGVLRIRTPWIRTLSSEQFDMHHPGRAVAVDGTGGMHFAVNCEGMRHWHADGRVTSWREPRGNPMRCVETLYAAPDGSTWVGASSGTLRRIAPGHSTPGHTIAQWEGNLPIRAIFSPAPDQLLVAVRRETYQLHLDADGQALDIQAITPLDGMVVRQIIPARAGGHWFVGDQGAFRLENGAIAERWSSDQYPSLHFARTLHEDKDGTLWIGTYGSGLSRVSNGQLHVYDQRNGLLDDTVSCILEDRQGRLWLGGNRGVSLLLSTTGPGWAEAVSFGTNDGLIPSEINGGNQSACAVDDRGRFWFTLVEGFAVLDPDEYNKPTPRPPPTHIEHVAVAGVAHDPHQPLRLNVSAANIEIGYTAINLSAPERLRFRFRLSGVNQDWIQAGNHRSIVYPSIPWGEHVFEVQARNEGEPWPETSAQLHILRRAPWYQRPWVWLLSTLLALILLLDANWQRPGTGRAAKRP